MSSLPERILVTGAAGCLGLPMIKELDHRGFDTLGCDLQHGVRHERCDISEYRQLERLIEEYEPEMVYHMAAEFGRLNSDTFYEQVWKTNAIGTRHLLKLQEQHRFRMVFFSSSEVYGDSPGLLHEDLQEVDPVRLHNDYAISKWVNEQQILNSIERSKTQTVRVRLFNTYGPGEYYTDYRSVVCLFVYRALHGIPYRVFEGYRRTSSYVDDSINTLANVTSYFVPGAVYNIAGSEYTEVKHLSDLVLKYTGADPSLVRYEAEDAHNTWSKKPDCTRAIRELGHAPKVALEEGIKRTVAWQRTVYGV